MQTFLPYASFSRSASVLDDKRLGKQRVEAYQILKALTVPGYGWQAHPAVLQWRGYEQALVVYAFYICAEWQDRGFRDTMQDKIFKDFSLAVGGGKVEFQQSCRMPPWLGNPKYHRSHRSNLLRKNPQHYRKYWPRLRDDLLYWWPSKELSR